MSRRLAGFFCWILVLTFTTSGSRVCNDMAHELGTQSATHTAPGAHGHHAPAPSDSHHTPGHQVPLDHCPTASSCASVVLAADIVVSSVDVSHNDRVVEIAALEPSSLSPDLETPPPKA